MFAYAAGLQIFTSSVKSTVMWKYHCVYSDTAIIQSAVVAVIRLWIFKAMIVFFSSPLISFPPKMTHEEAAKRWVSSSRFPPLTSGGYRLLAAIHNPAFSHNLAPAQKVQRWSYSALLRLQQYFHQLSVLKWDGKWKQDVDVIWIQT